MSEPRGPKRHHYVPHSYLAGFTDKGSKHGKLWVFDSRLGKHYRTKPLNAAVESDFYRIDVPGVDPNLVEKMLSGIEADGVEAIRQVTRAKTPPTGVEHIALSRFIALQLVRTGRTRSSTGRILGKILQMMMKMYTHTHEAWERTSTMVSAGEFDAHTDENKLVRELFLDGKPYEELRAWAWGDDFVTQAERRFLTKTDHVGLMVDVVPELSDIIELRSWSIMTTTALDGTFVTSDEPVSLIWTVPVPSWRGQPGAAEENSRLYFPLDRFTMLVGAMDWTSKFKELMRREVALLNSLTLSNASRFGYSDSLRSPSLRTLDDGQTVEEMFSDLTKQRKGCEDDGAS